jgi:hypothetical protein
MKLGLVIRQPLLFDYQDGKRLSGSGQTKLLNKQNIDLDQRFSGNALLESGCESMRDGTTIHGV